jgi:hypothetical protein
VREKTALLEMHKIVNEISSGEIKRRKKTADIQKEPYLEEAESEINQIYKAPLPSAGTNQIRFKGSPCWTSQLKPTPLVKFAFKLL